MGINDHVATGIIFQAVAHGFTIPRDYSITGFDDIPTAKYLLPPLTTVNHNYEKLAEAALQTLMTLMESHLSVDKVTVPVNLILRGSTGNPRKPA
jgi:DNA-binding LacI/PurR family transcriptional regulator